MIKAFVYRVYPTNSQRRQLNSTLETCRRWYNACLAERKTAYEERGETISKHDQLAKVKDLKANNPYAKDVHSHVLQTVVQDLEKAFQNFFRRVQSGETPGYPRFKGRNRFHSFGFKEHGNGFKIDGRRLKLSGIGRLRVRWHRPIEGQIKTVRLVRKAGDKWYACFACEIAPRRLPATERDVGVDVGVHSLLHTSDNVATPNPGWYRANQKKLRVFQRTVARRQKGGKNRRKAVEALQLWHEHISNQRKDFLNKEVAKLIHAYDLIGLEELQINNMVKNRRLSKSILDAGWGFLKQRLMSKAAEAGRAVVLVNPAGTSKICSCCGHEFEGLTLKVRWVRCEQCGLSLDRDHNAAINILKRAGHVRRALSSSVDGFAQEAPPL